MKKEEVLSNETIVPKSGEIVNTDEQISDYLFVQTIINQGRILKFDFESYGFCLE